MPADGLSATYVPVDASTRDGILIAHLEQRAMKAETALLVAMKEIEHLTEAMTALVTWIAEQPEAPPPELLAESSTEE